ncbi:MAG: hypothetical protein KGH78_01470 [Candidatus Micrarchaeota archaeon]|nr:hypothetical protein [Candidatus Micrarchaeota archaeon]
MDMNQIKRLVIPLFIAVIFIASYAAFGSNALPQTGSTTTTIRPPAQTVYASTNLNGTIGGYGQVFNILVGCNATLSPAASDNVSLLLTKLEANNSIYNYYSPNSTSFSVLVGKLNSYQSSSYISSRLSNSTQSCVSFSGQQRVSLPGSINFQVVGQQGAQSVTVPVPPSYRNYTIQSKLYPTGSRIPLRVAALLTQNGSIYSMNITALGGK